MYKHIYHLDYTNIWRFSFHCLRNLGVQAINANLLFKHAVQALRRHSMQAINGALFC